MLAKIYVKMKEGVLDPQGKTVMNSLETMGYQGITDVKVGKYMEVELDDGMSKEDAEKKINEMCEKLLANPIIETYTFEVQ